MFSWENITNFIIVLLWLSVLVFVLYTKGYIFRSRSYKKIEWVNVEIPLKNGGVKIYKLDRKSAEALCKPPSKARILERKPK